MFGKSSWRAEHLRAGATVIGTRGLGLEAALATPSDPTRACLMARFGCEVQSAD